MEKGLIVDLSRTAVAEKAEIFSKICIQMSQSESYDTNTTKEQFGIVKHPTLNLQAMLFDDAFQVPIVAYRDEDGALKPKVVAVYKKLASTLGYTNTQAKNFIENNDHFTVEQVINPKLPITGVEIKTRTEMEADGWFVEDGDL